nr:pectinesterase inhibitor 10-like [Lolium perenne]
MPTPVSPAHKKGIEEDAASPARCRTPSTATDWRLDAGRLPESRTPAAVAAPLLRAVRRPPALALSRLPALPPAPAPAACPRSRCSSSPRRPPARSSSAACPRRRHPLLPRARPLSGLLPPPAPVASS